MDKVPILIYHSIDDNTTAQDRGELLYSLNLKEFERQMNHLSDNDYCPISLNAYVAYVTRHFGKAKTGSEGIYSGSSHKHVIITFDDGHITNYTHAFPILKKYGFAATFFITVKNISSPDGLRSDQLVEMADSGMSIQSHTMTHPFLSDLSAGEIHWELRESKTILEEELGRPISYLALPGGRCNAAVKNIAREVGYRAICTSSVGYNHPNSDLYSLKRWAIKRHTELSTFSSIVSMKRSVAAYHKTRYFILGSMKKMLGNRRYVAIREKFL